MSDQSPNSSTHTTSEVQQQSPTPMTNVFWKKHYIWITLAPLVLAVVWTCLHPIVSIMTGELKCRGWYIDENALDAGMFRYEATFSLPAKDGHRHDGMCDTLSRMTGSGNSSGNIDCHRQYYPDDKDSYLEIAKLLPISNAVAPVSESIVLVVPSAADWNSSVFHNTILQLLIRLSDAQKTKWLAKTVILVSPSPTKSLTQSVDAFLDAYSGRSSYSVMKALPQTYTTSTIRNLLVLDVATNEGQQRNELLLLPQGRRGFLPNMDFFFLAMTVYSNSNIIHRGVVFGVHPYAPSSTILSKFSWVSSLSPFFRQWIAELFDMFNFVRTLAVGPYSAHASSLDQGIDALTVQLRVSSDMEQTLIHEFTKRLEGIIRALSNLHERLHHSLTQYLLPSPFKFVSQSEYIIPVILALVPLVIRAVSLLLFEMDDTLNASTFPIIIICFGVTAVLEFVTDKITDLSRIHAALALLYVSSTAVARKLIEGKEKAVFQSLHFLTCLLAIYLLIPLAIGHVSLGYPSVLFWSCLVAILPHRSSYSVHKLLWPVILLLAWPPVIAVPQVFGYYSPYMILVYFPLHFMSYLLWVFQNR